MIKIKKQGLKIKYRAMKVQVCTGKTCKERFSGYIATRLDNDKEKFGLEHLIIEESKCMGNCKYGPNIKIDAHKEQNANPAKISEIVKGKYKK